MGAFDCDSVFIFWNQDFRFSNIELRGWEISPQSFSWINRTPDITGFPPLLYLKKVTTNFKSCKHCLLWNLSISHFTSWYDMVWREKPGSIHERSRSICYHSRDWTPLGPITLTNLQIQGGHRLQYEEPDFFFPIFTHTLRCLWSFCGLSEIFRNLWNPGRRRKCIVMTDNNLFLTDYWSKLS